MKNESTLSGLTVANFSKQIDGKETMLCILTNNKGAELTITNYGAKIVSLMVPDRSGKLTDVVTGHNSIDEYLVSEEPYFGAICGRYGNRIAGGKFTLDGIVYDKLAINNGPNSLHGGLKGFNSVVWDLNKIDGQTVELKYTSADGEEGFPGKLDTTVTYHLSDDNEVIITYHAVTNKPTVLNLTNHSYFNLSGQGDPSVYDHKLTINADYYLPTDETAIPYGPKEKVEGTPMDFRTPHEVGERIDEDFEALNFGKEYDCSGLKTVPIGDEAKPGAASILTTVDGVAPKEYEIGIVKVDAGNRQNKNFVIKITDDELLAQTGGIVQGMSGSPIMQDGKLIGAVTHVFLNDPTRGYGIAISNMLGN